MIDSGSGWTPWQFDTHFTPEHVPERTEVRKSQAPQSVDGYIGGKARRDCNKGQCAECNIERVGKRVFKEPHFTGPHWAAADLVVEHAAIDKLVRSSNPPAPNPSEATGTDLDLDANQLNLKKLPCGISYHFHSQMELLF